MVETVSPGSQCSDSAQMLEDLRTELYESNLERDKLRRRALIGNAVAQRRSDAILGLRDYLVSSADQRCSPQSASGPDTPSTNATIAGLQDELMQARRDRQRAVAERVYQRQRDKRALDTIAFLQDALSLSNSEISKARSDLNNAKLEADQRASEANTISGLSEQLKLAQRDTQRAVAMGVLQRQKGRDALGYVATLKGELKASTDQLAAMRSAPSAESSATSELASKVALLQQDLSDAEHASQRALAQSISLRQQKTASVKTIETLRIALTDAESLRAKAQAEAEEAKLEALAAVSKASVSVSELQDRLGTAQRDAKRAIASSIFLRQRLNDAEKTVAVLRNDLHDTTTQLIEARSLEQPAPAVTTEVSQLTAKIADLEGSLSNAERVQRRAIAATVFQRQRRSIAESDASSLRATLAKTDDALRAANADVAAAHVGASADEARSTAKIAKLQGDLTEMQRTNQRATANALLQRRRLASATEAEAKLRTELEARHASAAKLSVTVAELRGELEKAHTQASQIFVMPPKPHDQATAVSYDDASSARVEPAGNEVEYATAEEPLSAVDAGGDIGASDDVEPVAAEEPERRVVAPLPRNKSAIADNDRPRAFKLSALPPRRRNWREPSVFRPAARDVIVVTVPRRQLGSRSLRASR